MPNLISAKVAELTWMSSSGCAARKARTLRSGFGPAQLGKNVGIKKPSRHKMTSRTGIGMRLGSMSMSRYGRGLHRGDQGFARQLALEPTKFFGRDDDDFVAAMHGHVLRAFAAGHAARAR